MSGRQVVWIKKTRFFPEIIDPSLDFSRIIRFKKFLIHASSYDSTLDGK